MTLTLGGWGLASKRGRGLLEAEDEELGGGQQALEEKDIYGPALTSDFMVMMCWVLTHSNPIGGKALSPDCLQSVVGRMGIIQSASHFWMRKHELYSSQTEHRNKCG